MTAPVITVPSLLETLLDALGEAISQREAEYKLCPGCRTAPDGIARGHGDHDEAQGRVREYESASALIRSAASGDPAARAELMEALSGSEEGRA